MPNCPYCTKIFDTWLKVRKHTSGCSLNNYTYYITLEQGPISYDYLKTINLRQFRSEFSNLSVSTQSSIIASLRKKHGYSILQNINPQLAKQAVIRFYKENGRNPTSRDTYKCLYLPTDFWAKKTFGSWNNFLEHCGLNRNPQAMGIKTKAKDGRYYLSTLEAKFVDKFLYGKFIYQYEKPYPNNIYNRISDFYLPELDLYIEVAGGMRPEVIKEKIDFCKANGLNLKVVHPKDLDKEKIF